MLRLPDGSTLSLSTTKEFFLGREHSRCATKDVSRKQCVVRRDDDGDGFVLSSLGLHPTIIVSRDSKQSMLYSERTSKTQTPCDAVSSCRLRHGDKIGLIGKASKEFILFVTPQKPEPMVEKEADEEATPVAKRARHSAETSAETQCQSCKLGTERLLLCDGVTISPWGIGTLPIGVLYND